MKKYFILFACLAALLTACKEEKADFYKGENYIRFYMDTYVGTSEYQAYPIEYPEALSSTNTESTAYFRLEVIGYPSDKPRKIRLRQFIGQNAGLKSAVSGVNFVPLDDPRMEEALVLPAGEMYVDIPIFLTYDPASVGTTQNLLLEFLIVESEDFKPVYSNQKGYLSFIQNLD